MHATETYDIHGLLTVRSNARLPIPAYFETAKTTGDRILEVVEDESLSPTIPPYARRLATHHYWFENETLTVTYPSPPFGGRLVVKLSGLGSANVRLSYTPAFRSNTDFDGLLEGILTTAFLDAGIALIHAGAVVDASGSTVLASMGRMGKTSTLLSLLRSDPGLGFMGDNILLLDESGQVYSWPATLGVFPGTAVADEQLPDATRLRVRLKRLLARSDIVSAALLHKFGVDLSENLHPDAVADHIVDSAPIDRFYLLNGGRPDVDSRVVDTDTATAKIATGTDMELDPADYYLSLYSFVADDESVHPAVVKERRRGILTASLAGLTVRELFADDVAGYTKLIG